MNQRSWTRRDFMRIGTGAVATGVAAKFTLLEPKPLWGAARPVPASDTVRFASIGTGVRGCELLEASLRVPGAECVAVCDLYDSRHTAAQKTNRIVQIGSQRVSSILYAQAKEIYDSGKLGEVYSIEAYWDRNSASGAWVYPIPRNASEQTIDWNAFLDGAPRRPFSPER